VPSSLKVPKTRRRRLKEFLRVEEIGSHIGRVTGTLENVVFRGMEESEKEIRAKRMWFSVFALILLVALGVTLSRRAQSEVAIFHPSACLGGWNGVEKAVGESETSEGVAFSNINSAILPENTVADLFCGDFKGEVPEDSEPKMLMLRIAWSVEGSTSTQVIEGESFASSTTEILDAPASTSPDFLLIEPTPATTTDTDTSSSTQTETNVTPQEQSGANGAESATPAPEVIPPTEVQVQEPTVEPTPEPVVPPEPSPLPPVEPTTETTPPQSYNISSKLFALVRGVFEKAYAQEEQSITTQTTETQTPELPASVVTVPVPEPFVEPAQEQVQPSVLEIPVDTPPVTNEEVVQPSVLETPINDAPQESAKGEENTIATTTTETTSTVESGATTTDINTASSTENATTTESAQPLFEVLYSLDGVTWSVLGGVTLEALRATQFQVPLPEGSSWRELSKLQIHIKRVASVDKAPTIFLDAITLEVEVFRTPHVEATHPDFTRDIVVRDTTDNGVRIVTIINIDTQLEETWYMYLDETVLATTTDITGTSTVTTALDIASTTGTTTESVGTLSTSTATSTETATTTDIKLPQMKEKNVWKKYLGKASMPTITDVLSQDLGVSIEDVASSTKELTEEEIILDLLPDLAADKIRRIKGVFLNSIIIQVIGKTKDELWLYDAENETQEKLESSTTTTVSLGYPLGIKGGFIFWLSNDETIIYAYNPTTKLFLEKVVPPFDATKGERAEIHFDEIPWEVIVNKDGFTFFSVETGEVFSDEDGRVQETLRKKFNLETILNAEKLNQLNFSVEKAEVVE
jgi:hypothetical protein